MFTNRFFTVLAILVLVAVLVLTVQEAIATSTVISNEQVTDNMERSREADTARWQAMVEYYQSQAEAQNLQRGRAADAARWEAMAEYYLSERTLVDPNPGLAIYQRSERSHVPVRFTKYQLSEWFGE